MSNIVLVGSTNEVKINACKNAFSLCFPSIQFEFIGIKSDSGVPAQPFGDETRLGAVNRVKSALNEWKKSHDSLPHYVVGLEGGLKHESFEYDIHHEKNGLFLFAWMVVYDPTIDRWGFGQTGGFMIPPPIAKLVNEGMELGDADDKYYGMKQSGHKNGTIGILTRDIIDRTEYYKHALIMALIPFMNESMY